MNPSPLLIAPFLAVALAVALGLACRSGCGEEPREATIPHAEVAGGPMSAVQEQRFVVARDESAWSELWSEHGRNQLPPPLLPEVDFDESLVVAVFLGSRPSGGYSVRIEEVVERGDGFVVRAVETRPAPDVMTTAALTAPFHAVSVPRRAGSATLELSIPE